MEFRSLEEMSHVIVEVGRSKICKVTKFLARGLHLPVFLIVRSQH